MTICRLFSYRILLLPVVAGSFLASCAVDEQASLNKGAAATGAASKHKSVQTDAEKKKEAAAKAKLAAAKAKEEAARKAAEQSEAKERAEKLALARKKEAESKARTEELLSREKEREAAKAAKLAAKAKADADRQAREASREIEALATRESGGGFFSRLSIGTSARQYKSEGHEIYVNHALLPALNAGNSKIEVDLSEQRARVYRVNGPQKLLVIETQISSGKSGHNTPTGTYRIGEKLVQKQSSLYGTWVDGSGNAVGGSSEAGYRPAGGSHFVGADMPYWMRINGGIGMHIGIVPDYPASHGCIRVPASVQPLIYSKVGVGTPVVITH